MRPAKSAIAKKGCTNAAFSCACLGLGGGMFVLFDVCSVVGVSVFGLTLVIPDDED